jgi:hypothetical protein
MLTMSRYHKDRPTESVALLPHEDVSMFEKVCRHLDQYPRVTLRDAFAAVRKQMAQKKDKK